MTRALMLIVLLSWPLFAIAKLNVAFMTPELKGDSFWDQTVTIAKKAASDLNINLIVIEGENHRLINQKVLSTTLNKLTYIDYFVFMPQTGKSVQSFELLNRRKIKFVTLEKDFTAKELEKIKTPGEVYPFWLGEIAYDDTKAGQDLAAALVSQLSESERPNVIAFSGGHDVISANREQGLSKALPLGSTLNQIVKTNWAPKLASSRIQRLVQRYPAANILWAASDDIALAALARLSDNQAKNLIAGGIDLTPEGLNSIANGKLKVSVGGHFMQAAWALVKIYDHHNGVNTFNNELLSHSVVTFANVSDYQNLINHQLWRTTNFKHFSNYESGSKTLELNLDSFLYK